jgi:drug/metabolite transporter (DMT)-like permease
MATGWSPAAAVVARIGIAAVLLTVPALRALRGRWQQVPRALPGIAAYGALAVAGGQLFYFNAVQHLSVAVALLLEYSGTLLVVVWMWLRHAQRPHRRTVGGGVLALAGLALVLDLTGAQHVDGIGVLWGLAAAVGSAAYFVLSARSADALPPIAMAWGGLLFGGATMGAAGLVHLTAFHARTSEVTLAGTQVSWLVPVLALSVVAAAIPYAAGIGAARRLGARLASFVGLSEVLFAVVVAWALLGQRPSAIQALGATVVLAGIATVRSGEPDEPLPTVPAAAALADVASA